MMKDPVRRRLKRSEFSNLPVFLPASLRVDHVPDSGLIFFGAALDRISSFLKTNVFMSGSGRFFEDPFWIGSRTLDLTDLYLQDFGFLRVSL